jgi:excinuclease ABC subunit B
MAAAIEVTEQRRQRQEAFNREHGIVPRSTTRKLVFVEQAEEAARRVGVEKPSDLAALVADPHEAAKVIERLRRDMKDASKRLEFERAADLRDKIRALQAVLGGS